jgi:hypothetical protein
MIWILQSGQWIRIRIHLTFFFYFRSSKPWIRISIQPKMLNLDLDQMNTNPKHCQKMLNTTSLLRDTVIVALFFNPGVTILIFNS